MYTITTSITVYMYTSCTCVIFCLFLGSYLLAALPLGDTAAGALLLIFSLLLLCGCLVTLVKILNSLLKGRIAKLIHKSINSELPGCLSCLTGYLAIIVGALLTILVQSSSVFTSTLTPLVGIGVIRLERMYPLTLGSNIGTTGTGLLAALAAPGDKLSAALQIALVHLFFNISGILLFYPVPRMRWPIGMAKKLGLITATYRWFAIFYLVCMFFVIPGLVFALSMLHIVIFAVVISILVALVLGSILFYFIVSKMQKRCPRYLPARLHSWGEVPLWQRLLQPLDNIIQKIPTLTRKLCCRKTAGSKPYISAEMTQEQELEEFNALNLASQTSSPPRSLFSNDGDIVMTSDNVDAKISESGADSGYCTRTHTPSPSVHPSRAESMVTIHVPS